MTNKGANSSFKLEKQFKATEALGGHHVAQNYLPKLFQDLGINHQAKILDIGCGIGIMVRTLGEIGYDAYGLEPGGRFNEIEPEMRPYIYNCYADEYGKIASDKNDKFDVVMSFGVIEHVGTIDGHACLSSDFLDYRFQFIEDQIKLLKPGGILLVMGPNRLFPFDFQHGSHDYGFLSVIKKKLPFIKILQKLTLPWHSKNYLVSWDDLYKIGKKLESELDLDNDFSYFCPKQDNLLGLSSLQGKDKEQLLFRIYTKLVDKLPTQFRKVLYTHTLFVLKYPQNKF